MTSKKAETATNDSSTIAHKIFRLRQRVQGFLPEKTNPHFKSKFFNINQMIEEIQPALEEIELLLMQPINIRDGKNVMVCLVIDPTTGTSEELGSMLLPEFPDPQKMGSALTYYRRQMLKSIFFWGDIDDDANDAVVAVNTANKIAQKPMADAGQMAEIRKIITQHKVDEQIIMQSYGVKSLEEIDSLNRHDLLTKLKAKYEGSN